MKSWGLLSRVENVRDLQPAALIGVADHRFRVGGRDDHPILRRQTEAFQRQLPRTSHGAAVEGDDLIVRFVGVDEAGSGELVFDFPDAGNVDSVRLHPDPVFREILASRCQHQRMLAHQGKVVGDVPRHPAPHPAHRIDQKADGEGVNFVRKDVILEESRKVHDVVVGQRSGNHNAHRQLQVLGEGTIASMATTLAKVLILADRSLP